MLHAIDTQMFSFQVQFHVCISVMCNSYRVFYCDNAMICSAAPQILGMSMIISFSFLMHWTGMNLFRQMTPPPCPPSKLFPWSKFPEVELLSQRVGTAL